MDYFDPDDYLEYEVMLMITIICLKSGELIYKLCVCIKDKKLGEV